MGDSERLELQKEVARLREDYKDSRYYARRIIECEVTDDFARCMREGDNIRVQIVAIEKRINPRFK